MMPELGRYATEVLSAWGISLALLALVVWRGFARDRAARRALAEAEEARHGR